MGGGIDDSAQTVHHGLDARAYQLGDGAAADDSGDGTDNNIYLGFAGDQPADLRAEHSADVCAYRSAYRIAVCAGYRAGEKNQRF